MSDRASSQLARFLALVANAAPSADNSQPLEFSWDGQEFTISYSQHRGIGKLFGSEAHPTLLSVGMAIENLIESLEILNLPIAWRLDDSLGAGAPYVRFALNSNIPKSLNSERFPLFNRHTNRFPYCAESLKSDELDQILGMVEGKSRIFVASEKSVRSALSTLTRRAAEVRFCTQELHNWLMSSLRFSPDAVAKGDGLDVATLHLPPGGRFFLRSIADWRHMAILNRIGTYKGLAISEVLLLREAPALVAIVGPRGPLNTIDAGRLLGRAWTKLNQMGIAVHPYYVLTDQLNRLEYGAVPGHMVGTVKRIEQELPSVLALAPEETLHMLLRVGYPRKDPPRSRRLPIESVFKDISG